jgi:hypothetical protein
MFIFPWQKRAFLYLHFPCFDGTVSGVLAILFLRKTRRWKFKTFQPVNYHLQREWLGTGLPRRSAVVDFLYHPGAEFWADHHETSFLNEQLRKDFESRQNGSRFYDRASGSCAALLWRHVSSDLGPDARLEEMVRWAEKIDSASYVSVEEAFSNSHPALILSRSLAIEADQKYCKFLVTRLQTDSLAEVSQSAEVQKRLARAKVLSALGLERVRQTIRMEGTVAIFEANTDGVLMNRYCPYYFFPQARYSIAMTHSQHSTKVTSMRNPWLQFEGLNLGAFMGKFGGGGHQRVGSLILPRERDREAQQVVSLLLQQISEQELRLPKLP